MSRRNQCLSGVHCQLLSLLVVLVCWSDSSAAWGGLGHATICQIAWLEMKDTTRHWLTPVYRAKGYASFAQSCNWADHIKSQSRFDYLKPHHYVNMPRAARRFNSQLALCGQRSCITEEIKRHQRQLEQGAVENPEQSILLLAHFIGDIHQPMHVSHAEDWGGNKLAVRVPGQDKRQNLHWLWDVWMVQQAGVRDWRRAAPELLQSVSARQRQRWLQADGVDQWAAESYRQARKIYAEYHSDSGVGPGYVKRHRRYVRQRLQQAGIRLAQRLDRAASMGESVL